LFAEKHEQQQDTKHGRLGLVVDEDEALDLVLILALSTAAVEWKSRS